MTEPEIQLHRIYGQCPVQAEGSVNGVPFYFRARWDQWEMYIASWPDIDPLNVGAWRYEEDWGEGFDASYMPQDVAYGFIIAAARMWLAGQASMGVS